jgi:two-component system response regulator (stage 0 sporulation protein F)
MPHALVVDDDTHVCLAIRSFLEAEGIDAVIAESAEDGFKAFDLFNFDVLLVDIFMPKIDGLKAIKVFQQQAPKTSIIAMSGLAPRYAPPQQFDYFGMALKLGASCCLHKPFQAEQLLAAVETCLGELPRRCAPMAAKDF